MRIAFMVGAFPTLSETFVIDQVAALIDAGHDVRVLAERPGPLDIAHPDVERLSLIDRTTYFDTSEGRGIARKLGDATHRARLTRSIQPAYRVNAYAIASAARILERIRDDQREFDAVICHFGPRGVAAAALRDVGLLQGPIATIFHAYEISRDLTDAWRGAFRALGEQTELLLPCSRYWQRLLVDDIGVPHARVVVHRMGVRVPESMPERPSAEGPTRITIVGRLEPKKGHATLIDAFKRLPREAATLSIVGDGSLRAELERRASDHPSFRFAGAVPPDRVRGILETETDVFCLPSVTAPDGDMEGLPVSIMEAMAAGVPVVSTSHSGIPELVIDGVTGLLVPEHDAAALAAALESCIDDPAAAHARAERGFRAVHDGFNASAWNRVLIECCEALSRGDTDVAAREPSFVDADSWEL